MHLGHERDAGEVLAEAVMQILADAALFTCADFEQRSLQLLALGDVDAGGNDVVGRSVVARQHGAGPRDQAVGIVPRDPMALKILGQQVSAQLRKDGTGTIDFFWQEEKVPDALAADLFERIAGGEFASAVEADDAPFGIENSDERADGIENRGDDIAFLLQSAARCP